MNIKNIEKLNNRDSLGNFEYLVGEVSELLKAIVYESKENQQMEAVDVAICAMAVYLSSGGRPEDFEAKVAEKVQKWADSMKVVL